MNVPPAEPPREHLPQLRRHLETAGAKVHGGDCIIKRLSIGSNAMSTVFVTTNEHELRGIGEAAKRLMEG
jgi:hypothetical protein